MSDRFELEWMGGVAEHHFHKARPGVDDFAWDTLDPARFSEAAVIAARNVWTDVAHSEYVAIAAFSDVVAALTLAKAPLDLIGMTGDFLADEARHVELASRLVMQLGGAALRAFEPERLSPRLSPDLTPFQRANELALRIGCIAEVYAGGTAAPMMRTTTHPLVRSVYASILRDEARHKRFGSLYFEWAGERLDDAERERLARVALSTLASYAPLWRKFMRLTPGTTDVVVDTRSFLRDEEVYALGWVPPVQYVPLALSVVRDQIVPGLRAIGIALPQAEVEALLGCGDDGRGRSD
ncbi:MAG: ferritin-like domain-containing protein [Polyangiales bacterium]